MDHAPTSYVPLTELLDLTDRGNGLFASPPVQDGLPRVFGGQTAAQALAAAAFTVDDSQICHSLHGRFLRPGQPGRPAEYEVTSLQDAKRFATRLVIGTQRHTPFFQLTASFQSDSGDSPSYSVSAPDVPAPEDVPDQETLLKRHMAELPEAHHGPAQRRWPMEFRYVNSDLSHWISDQPQHAEQYIWMRMRDELPAFPNLHRCALAYAIDATLVRLCFLPLPMSPLDQDVQTASLDHCLWFHRPFSADRFMLIRARCTQVADGRGMTESHVFQDGELVATVVQEALLHRRNQQA